MQSKAEPAQAAVKAMSNSTPRTTATSAANKLDPIAVLREELAAAAVCHGVERVEDLTEELVRRYVQRLGGVQVYVPTERFLDRQRVAKEIRASFDGCNAIQLASKFGLSPRWVREILRASE
jgi:Mor family transcriptional regulator